MIKHHHYVTELCYITLPSRQQFSDFSKPKNSIYTIIVAILTPIFLTKGTKSLFLYHIYDYTFLIYQKQRTPSLNITLYRALKLFLPFSLAEA